MFPESSSELLDEYDAGLCLSQHDNLVDRGDIDPFVEYIHGDDIVQLIGLETPDSFAPFLLRVLSGKGDGPVATCIQHAAHFSSLLSVGDEHESTALFPGLAVVFDFFCDVIDAFAIHQLGK